jgi:hypothetical protein
MTFVLGHYRLSVDSSNYVPSRMSMESNVGFMVDASSRLSTDQEGLGFDETFKRMSLDHPQFSASLGVPLETVAERQELVCPLPLHSSLD